MKLQRCVVIKPSIVPTLLYVSPLHTKDSPLSNNRLARNVVVLLQIISDIIIPPPYYYCYYSVPCNTAESPHQSYPFLALHDSWQNHV